MTDFESVIPTLQRLHVELKYKSDGTVIADLSDYIFVVHTEVELVGGITIVEGTVAWPIRTVNPCIQFEQNRVVGLPPGALAVFSVQVLTTIENYIRAVDVRSWSTL